MARRSSEPLSCPCFEKRRWRPPQSLHRSPLLQASQFLCFLPPASSLPSLLSPHLQKFQSSHFPPQTPLLMTPLAPGGCRAASASGRRSQGSARLRRRSLSFHRSRTSGPGDRSKKKGFSKGEGHHAGLFCASQIQCACVSSLLEGALAQFSTWSVRTCC